MKHLIASLLFLFHQPSPEQPTMKLSQNCGDSRTHAVSLTWNKVAFIPGDDWSLVFTVKHKVGDEDDEAVIQKSLGAGISVTGSTASIEIIPQDTKELSPGGFVWGLRATHLTTGERRTIVSVGSLTLVRGVAKDDVTTIPVYTANPPVLLGAPGKSAYQVAVDSGYAGTAEQWLASLQPQVPQLTSQAIADALQYSPAPYVPVLTRTAYEGAPQSDPPDGTISVSGTLARNGSAIAFPKMHQLSSTSWASIGEFPVGTCSFGDGRWTLTHTPTGSVWTSTAQVASPDLVTAGYYSPFNLTAWQPSYAVTGNPVVTFDGPTAGILGQECVVDSADIYKCAREAPVKWVKLN